MIELTDEIINQVDTLLDDFALPAVEIGMAAAYGENMPKRYINDNILIEYYNGIKEGKTSDEMRKICLPNYIRRELNKNN